MRLIYLHRYAVCKNVRFVMGASIDFNKMARSEIDESLRTYTALDSRLPYS